MRRIHRVFVANRGEIAVRIIRACRKLGVESVIGVSAADRASLGAELADRAVCIGPAPAAGSYLNKDALVHAAMATGCDALHPGYGFLAENAAFERLCAENGIRFIGPAAAAIETMGDKINAIAAAKAVHVPTVPGSDHVASAAEAKRVGKRIGYPFLFKARAGGGGRGMRIVRNSNEADAAFDGARAEAGAAFGNDQLYIEKYIEDARHIEVQVLGDEHGRVAHLGERDCSVQRRHQKLIEEAPSPVVTPELRTAMADSAVRLAASQGYVGAGTVEFIFDAATRDFYFLEMNTRVQVEHPVTEMVTGVDIVAEQIRVADGEALSIGTEPVLRGHSIECRINAEMPERGFLPSPGRIGEWQPPQGEGVRLDTHCHPGYFVPPFYDSMIAKLIVHAEDRQAAIRKMDAALAAFRITGIATTVDFHRAVIAHPDFRGGRVTTAWLERSFMPTYVGPTSSEVPA
ncbi:MAG TPA: acetyl-CoA carboxylase biotin carboxylase subunit [Croceibacterium sp.]|nr:acetyl-CoA carboxylase biotin carboxylase subunit [Croceibacterium sp.]